MASLCSLASVATASSPGVVHGLEHHITSHRCFTRISLALSYVDDNDDDDKDVEDLLKYDFLNRVDFPRREGESTFVFSLAMKRFIPSLRVCSCRR
jgi:hypothetical protein